MSSKKIRKTKKILYINVHAPYGPIDYLLFEYKKI